MSTHPVVRIAFGVFAAALLATGCAGTAGTQVRALPRDVALVNAGFELDPVAGVNCAPQWECSAHSDPGSFQYRIDESAPSGGKRSLRIERVRNEPWGLATQVVRDPALRGAKLRFSIAVRAEGAAGEGGGPYFFAIKSGGAGAGHEQRLVKGTTRWDRVSIEFRVPDNAELFEVGACLYGPGRVWFDDARLEVLELAVPAKKPV